MPPSAWACPVLPLWCRIIKGVIKSPVSSIHNTSNGAARVLVARAASEASFKLSGKWYGECPCPVFKVILRYFSSSRNVRYNLRPAKDPEPANEEGVGKWLLSWKLETRLGYHPVVPQKLVEPVIWVYSTRSTITVRLKRFENCVRWPAQLENGS